MSRIQRNKPACYCVNLRRAANAVSGLYNDFLAPVGLSVNQFSLLKNMGRLGRASVSDLAAFVGLERTTLVRTLKPLIERALIADLSEQGQRSKALELTEQGRMAVEHGAPLWQKAQDEVERRIGSGGAAALSQLLTALTDSCGEPPSKEE